jgi:hypothetical protein
VTQGRSGQSDVRLNVACGDALWASLDDEAEDLQADGMAERAELLGVTFELRGHDLLLVFSKDFGKAYFDFCGCGSAARRGARTVKPFGVLAFQRLLRKNSQTTSLMSMSWFLNPHWVSSCVRSEGWATGQRWPAWSNRTTRTWAPAGPLP